MSTGGQLLFAIMSLVAVVSAVLTVAQRSPLRAAVSLLVHVISLAGLYLTLHAHLLAAIQMLVYAGAVVVLFVFVIMLIGPGAMETTRDQRGLMVKILGGAMLALMAGAIAFQVGEATATFEGIPGCPDGGSECNQFGGVNALGTAIYVGAAIPFELVSILLLVAIVGAVAVARGHTDEEKKSADKPLPARPAPADALPESPGNIPR